ALEAREVARGGLAEVVGGQLDRVERHAPGGVDELLQGHRRLPSAPQVEVAVVAVGREAEAEPRRARAAERLGGPRRARGGGVAGGDGEGGGGSEGGGQELTARGSFHSADSGGKGLPTIGQEAPTEDIVAQGVALEKRSVLLCQTTSRAWRNLPGGQRSYLAE